MVLDKLGDSLKGTLGKIAKSLFVDEKLINELVKDWTSNPVLSVKITDSCLRYFTVETDFALTINM